MKMSFFNVKQENHAANLSKSVIKQYNEAQFDAFLKTGTEKYGCHRLILAFSSDFLKECLLSVPPGIVPVILLPDINTQVVKYLLIYMYKGEVNIPAEIYSDFVEACSFLEIKGFVNIDELMGLSDFEDFDEETFSTMIDTIESHEDQMEEAEMTGNEDQKPEVCETKEAHWQPWGVRPFKSQRKIPYILTPSLEADLLEKLHRALSGVYKSFGHVYIRDDGRIKLVMDGHELLYAFYRCQLCETGLIVTFSTKNDCVPITFRQWFLDKIKSHLQKHEWLNDQTDDEDYYFK